MSIISIAQIEQAINFWRARGRGSDPISLCREARILADVYGMMIFRHESEVAVTRLSDEQQKAFAVALGQLSVSG